MSEMTAQYIIENIYPKLKRMQQLESRAYWAELSTDKHNSHLHALAKERIAYIDSHPEEYPYFWMPTAKDISGKFVGSKESGDSNK